VLAADRRRGASRRSEMLAAPLNPRLLAVALAPVMAGPRVVRDLRCRRQEEAPRDSPEGTGVSSQRGGGDVPRNVLIYPLLLSYDETSQQGYFSGGGFEPLVWNACPASTGGGA
jgi:hypothetical protein